MRSPADDSVRAADDPHKPKHRDRTRALMLFDWGSFRFTFTDASARPPRGQWQAKFRFRKLNDKNVVYQIHNNRVSRKQ